MKDLGHYTIEIERAGLKVRASAGGLVAVLMAIALVALFGFLLLS